MVQEEAPLCGKFVLVVEDEPLLLLMPGDIVGDAGFEAILVPNADEAIRVLESRDDISIVFTDVNMPGSMDGLRLAATVRNRWPPIQLVVVSGHLAGDPELPAGARFLRKPYATEQMISVLRELAA